MKLIIDGQEYEFDGDWLVNVWQEKTATYVDPASPDARKYTDIRLALKGLLRLHLPKVLQLFAEVFHVDDWRTLKPGKNDDLLLTLQRYMALLMHAEVQNLTLELRTVQGSVKPVLQKIGDLHVVSESSPRAVLALTGATLGEHTLYQRDEQREPLTDGEQSDEQPDEHYRLDAPACAEKTGA